MKAAPEGGLGDSPRDAAPPATVVVNPCLITLAHSDAVELQVEGADAAGAKSRVILRNPESTCGIPATLGDDLVVGAFN